VDGGNLFVAGLIGFILSIITFFLIAINITADSPSIKIILIIVSVLLFIISLVYMINATPTNNTTNSYKMTTTPSYTPSTSIDGQKRR